MKITGSCTVVEKDGTATMYGLSREEARLVHAAPDLLNALRPFAHSCPHHGQWLTDAACCGYVRAARKAVEKAEISAQ